MNLNCAGGIEISAIDFRRNRDGFGGFRLLHVVVRLVEISRPFEPRDRNLGDISNVKISVQTILETERLVARAVRDYEFKRELFGDSDYIIGREGRPHRGAV